MKVPNREFGSDFHYVGGATFGNDGSSNHLLQILDRFYFSGRAALFAIIEHGIKNLSWRKLYVPTYYCLEVYDYIKCLDIELEYYEYNPFSKYIKAEFVDSKDHVLLGVNYFGIHKPNWKPYKELITIEDTTHDLDGITRSEADFVFGSLRKTLPLPVGGGLKVNQPDFILPVPGYAPTAEEAALEKLSGMFLKWKYLTGSFSDKAVFRSLFTHAEGLFELKDTNAALPDFVRDMLLGIDHVKIGRKRQENSQHIKKLIQSNELFDLVTTDTNSEYACIMKFHRKDDREKMLRHLISSDIFPAILWPGQIGAKNKQIEETILLVHIDFRYSLNDIEHIARYINYFTNVCLRRN